MASLLGAGLGLWPIVRGLLSLAGAFVQLILARISQGRARIFAIGWFVVWIAYWNAIVIMAYHDLRVAKEGIDTEQIATIFD